ncbi:MAG: hypothetical protein QOF51_2666, partial [Chloroflexota bacterium]|nr:hypothetical protein [Chloroflexota bacterium]
MTTAFRFTSKDLKRFPDIDGVRYEIIDGELFVSRAPHWDHQYACDETVEALKEWDRHANLGRALSGPGVIFSPENDVIPDVIWIRRDRLEGGRDSAGHLRVAPDLMVEVLSAGAANELRDRQSKLDL